MDVGRGIFDGEPHPRELQADIEITTLQENERRLVSKSLARYRRRADDLSSVRLRGDDDERGLAEVCTFHPQTLLHATRKAASSARTLPSVAVMRIHRSANHRGWRSRKHAIARHIGAMARLYRPVSILLTCQRAVWYAGR